MCVKMLELGRPFDNVSFALYNHAGESNCGDYVSAVVDFLNFFPFCKMIGALRYYATYLNIVEHFNSTSSE